jgi:hypothetical protein
MIPGQRLTRTGCPSRIVHQVFNGTMVSFSILWPYFEDSPMLGYCSVADLAAWAGIGKEEA